MWQGYKFSVGGAQDIPITCRVQNLQSKNQQTQTTLPASPLDTFPYPVMEMELLFSRGCDCYRHLMRYCHSALAFFN